MSAGKLFLVAAVFIAVLVLGRQGWLEWQLRQPGFHDRDCWFESTIVGEARCGIMVVTENRDDPESRYIRLPVIVFAAGKHVPEREPILYLTGGPGGAAQIGEAEDIEGWWSLRRSFPQGHPLVIMGQRGTGLNEPDFDCPELRGIETKQGPQSPAEPTANIRALSIKAAVDCSERLIDDGIDLTAYNSRQSAADIAELRLALDIEAWTLYGVSYGSRLALSTLRYHPEGIRSVILDSVFPPEASWNVDAAANVRGALQRVFADCAADEGCVRQNGDLEAAYLLAIEQLTTKPPSFTMLELFGADDRVFTVGDRKISYSPRQIAEDKNSVITIDAELFNNLLLDALLTKETRALIPVLLRETAEGRQIVLRTRLRDSILVSSRSNIAKAVYLSHVCHDEVPFEDPAAIAAAVKAAGPLGHFITEGQTSFLCEVWPAGNAGPQENTPVKSAVPALLLAGRYDPLTPPALARAAAVHLSNGYAFEHTELSHHVLYDDDCAERLVAEFLADPNRRPEGLCWAWELVTPEKD
ncbi:alpha/beta fold hydrolase [Pelagibius sp.]|uniref:alpha/beta fold hydrolase n=1 Tax=Pelagibius sp. TaxID=1931238 RepID=UPI003BB1E09D